MSKQEKYFVQVDAYQKWTPGVYREVNAEELDVLLDHYGRKVLQIVSNGTKGAMAMLACFKSQINGGCYSDMINAYRLLSDDPKNLVEREHELRHLWNQYDELWRIRYYGTVEAYYLAKAEKAREYFDKYKPKGETV